MALEARIRQISPLIAAVGIVLWLMAVGVIQNRILDRGANKPSPTSKVRRALDAGVDEPLLRGQVDLARADVSLDDASLFLVWFGNDGQELSRTTLQLESDGTFAIGDATDLPYLTLPMPLVRLEVDAPWHLAASEPITVRDSGDGLTIQPRVVRLAPRPVEPLFTLLLLMPALLGLPFALSHLRPRPNETLSLSYALINGASWAMISGLLVWAFARHELHWIPLFWPEIQVSSGLIVFTFLGTMVYAAWSVYHREPKFFTDETLPEERDKLLRAIGGRLLVAPYVSLVGWVMLSLVFPTLQGGAGSLFFGFFTGIWIRIVLKMLDDTGQRLLFGASGTIAEHLRRPDAPEVEGTPTRRSRQLPPPPAGYRDAIQRAREQLHALDGVIGVGAGTRVSRLEGQTSEPVIKVYVSEKEVLDADDPKRVPETIAGIRTDVSPLPAPRPDENCSSVAFDLFWDKIGPAFAPQADDLTVEWVGDVLVLHHPDPLSLYADQGRHHLFSPFAAYPLIQEALGDAYDFVAFVLDDSATLRVRHFYSAVFNDVAGIDFYLDPSPNRRFDRRDRLGVERLRGFQVHPDKDLDLRVMLHEFAHAWCSYVDFNDSMLLLTEDADRGMHWSHFLDDGLSCMNYRHGRWIGGGGQQFQIQKIVDGAHRLCALDLYLMGLMSRDELLHRRDEWPRRIHTAEPYDRFRSTYHGTAETIPIEAALERWGERLPRATAEQGTRTYRQIFVAVGSDLETVRTLANRVDALRLEHERNVHLATDQRLELLTHRAT